MLTATPKSWLSANLAVAGSTGHLADVAMSMWREKGTLTVAGQRYALYRKRPMSGLFILESDSGVLATAEKPSVWSSRLLIEHAGSRYELKRRSMFSRTFDLHAGPGSVGSISARNAFTRGMNIDLPESLPLPVRLFIVWLVAILWNREAAAAGG
jgi:hypothetical protein